MDSVQRVPKKVQQNVASKGHVIIGKNVHPAYAAQYSMYRIPPTEEITVQEVESFAFDRVRVLKEIENARVNGLTGHKYNDAITNVTRRYLPLNSSEDIRKDVISHFILRLAYCRPADRQWFLTQEAALLKFRLFSSDKTIIKSFLENNNLKQYYKPATPSELEAISSDLKDLYNENIKSLALQSFYKVRFEEALELVRQRKVLLYGGDVFVREEDFSSILVARFRLHLAESLVTAFKANAQTNNKFDSIAPILHHISTMYVNSDYKVDTTKRAQGKVDLSQLDMLSKRSFPMCMKNLHEKLRENHHLRHAGRLQYGLFLKGIGLTLEDALTFWRSEFTKIMGVDKFDKDYVYNIRHSYGKEGKRTDYTPYSCINIIMGVVTPNEHHGCPFRHFDADNLKAKMLHQGVSEGNARDVLDLVKGGHYQIACRKHFEVTHPNYDNSDMLIINHPNQYFDESEKYFNSGQAVPAQNINNNNNQKQATNNAITNTFKPVSLDEYQQQQFTSSYQTVDPSKIDELVGDIDFGEEDDMDFA